jgi:hypothetical protein
VADELSALDPDVEGMTLSTGFPIEIVRMQTRQYFRLLKVFTHGAGPRLLQEGLDFDADAAAFVTRLAAFIAMSVPDAESETIDFLKSVSQPAGLVGGLYGKQRSQLTKQEAENDDALWAQFNREMFNPDPMDTVGLIEKLVHREAADIQALGKKLTAVFKMATKTGQATDEGAEPVPEGQELNSAEHSPASSTSSPASTGGPTSTSSASPSAASGSARRPRPSAVSRASAPS